MALLFDGSSRWGQPLTAIQMVCDRSTCHDTPPPSSTGTTQPGRARCAAPRAAWPPLGSAGRRAPRTTSNGPRIPRRASTVRDATYAAAVAELAPLREAAASRRPPRARGRQVNRNASRRRRPHAAPRLGPRSWGAIVRETLPRTEMRRAGNRRIELRLDRLESVEVTPETPRGFARSACAFADRRYACHDSVEDGSRSSRRVDTFEPRQRLGIACARTRPTRRRVRSLRAKKHFGGPPGLARIFPRCSSPKRMPGSFLGECLIHRAATAPPSNGERGPRRHAWS
jgi:hypothetical protein